MKVESLQIQNFGILNEIKLDMSGSNGNLVFINGLNGRGKTTLQSAMKWCFYGEEPKSSTKFASRFAMKSIKDGESLNVKVSATISLATDGSTAYIERSQIFMKIAGAEPKKLGAPVLLIKTKASEQSALTRVEENPESWINRYFPKRLVNFFLFDGEQMVNFFQANVKEEIEKAIREIAGVDLFDEIAKNLEVIEIKFYKQASKLTGPRTQIIAGDREIAKRIQNEVQSELRASMSELEIVKRRITEINSLLGESANIELYAKRLEELEIEIEKLETQRDIAEVEFNSLLLGSGIVSMLSGSFKELEAQVKLATREDRLPPPFDPARIQLLINNGKCICGCEITPGDERTLELQKLMEKHALSTDIGKLLDISSKESEKTMAVLKSDWQTIGAVNKNISRYIEDIEKNRNEKFELIGKLQGNDLTSIRKIASEKQDLEDKKESLIRKVKDLEIQNENATAKVRGLDLELESAAHGNLEAELLRKQAYLAHTIAEAASKIHGSAIKQVREKLEKAVEDKFRIVKAGKFRTVINENFEVLTLNEDGTKADLSEGESMAKAYVFSLALRDVIKLDFPLIVDTPFGRLSGDFRAWLSNVLATFLTNEAKEFNKQVIFLMTDTEYTPYTKKRFESSNPMEFYLAYEKNHETDKSILGNGIDPEWLQHDYWKDWSEGKMR